MNIHEENHTIQKLTKKKLFHYMNEIILPINFLHLLSLLLAYQRRKVFKTAKKGGINYAFK